MKRIPRPLLIGGAVVLAVAGPITVHHFGGTPAGPAAQSSTAPASTLVVPSAVAASDVAGVDLGDSAPDQQQSTGSPDDVDNVVFAALAFAHAEFDVAGVSPAEWRLRVAALCTDVLAASVNDADPPADGATVDAGQPLTVTWIGEHLAQVPVAVTMAGHARVLTVTVVEAGAKWLVSDVDLSQS